MGIVRQFLPRLMEAQGGGRRAPAEMEGSASGIAGAAAVAGIVFAVVWLAAKTAYCVVGSVYLRSPRVRGLFEPGADGVSPSAPR